MSTGRVDILGFLLAFATALAGAAAVRLMGRVLGRKWELRAAEFLASGVLTFAALFLALVVVGGPPGAERFLLPVAIAQFLAVVGAFADHARLSHLFSQERPGRETTSQSPPQERSGPLTEAVTETQTPCPCSFHLVAPWLRLAATVWFAWTVAQVGVRVEALKVPFSAHSVLLGPAATAVTALWLTAFSFLFGRAASIAGVAQGVAAAAALTFYAVCQMRPDLTSPEGAFFSALLAGACLPQALFCRTLEAYGGTAGGYVVGFYVGVASIVGALKNTAFLVAALPLIAVGAPLFAVAYTYVAQLRGGWSAVAYVPGGTPGTRRHLHEVLLEQGYSPAQIRRLVLAGTVYLCLLALLLVAIIEVPVLVKLLLVALAAALGLAVFYVFLRMMHRPALEHQTGGPRAVELLGIKLNPVGMPQALAQAEEFLREDRPHMIVTTDATGFMRAQDDPEFRDIVNQADLVTPDGAGVVLAARLLNIPVEARCSGCDMVAGLCRVAAGLGRSVYLLGAGPGVAERAAEKLTEQTPGLVVAGAHDGYFSEEEEPAIVEEIKRARPGVLFVALGIPRQEKWIRGHLEELGVPVCVGVGGSFDVISGLKRRAPVWMQRAGLEWVFRVAQEPWRLPRLKALPRLVLLAFAELLRPPSRLEG